MNLNDPRAGQTLAWSKFHGDDASRRDRQQRYSQDSRKCERPKQRQQQTRRLRGLARSLHIWPLRVSRLDPARIDTPRFYVNRESFHATAAYFGRFVPQVMRRFVSKFNLLDEAETTCG